VPKPDKLDYAISIILGLLLLVVAPVLVGRAATPHVDGEPILLNATVLQEQQYIADARDMIALCAGAHADLDALPSATQAAAASAALQRHVDATDRAWSEWEGRAPPGRFATLHGQILSLIKLYRYLAGEAWSYYGDLDAAHLAEVQRGLGEGLRERERLTELLDALDFQSAPPKESAAPAQDSPFVEQPVVEEW